MGLSDPLRLICSGGLSWLPLTSREPLPMPIAITDEHQELASTVRGVLTAHKALQAARTRLESDDEPRP